MKLIPVNENGRRIGEGHYRAKLSDEIVDRIRELHEDQGKSYGWIALKLKVSKVYVQMICTYRRRAQTPERFKRVE